MNRFGSIVKLRKRHIDDINRYGDYLFPGLYKCCCFANSRYMWKRCNGFSSRFISWCNKGISKKQKIKSIFVSSTKRISRKTELACGTSLYVSRKGNAKIFSRDNKHVFFFVNDVSLFKRAAHYNSNYAPYFGRSIIEDLDSVKKMIKERCVTETYNWRNDETQVKNAVHWLIRCSSMYLGANQNNDVRDFSEFAHSVYAKTDDSGLRHLLKHLFKCVNLNDYDIPFVYQHNDMVLSNILKDNNKYTLFDYEFYSKNIFYYDSIMWLVWESVNYCHDTYLLEYLQGVYDCYFAELFNQVGMIFNPNKRKEYIILFMIANINIHLITGDETNILKYQRVVDTFLTK